MLLIRRRVLVVLLLAAAAIVGAGAPALACPSTDASFQDQAKQASAVFTGAVSDRREGGRRVVYAVDVDRVYKGRLDGAKVSVTTSASSRACGLPDLRTGRSYLFLADDTDGRLTTSSTDGTARATGDLVARVERLLGDGRPATPPEPPQATFTTVAEEPAAFQRVAAPGAALVIIGLLGLVFLSLLGRRRG